MQLSCNQDCDSYEEEYAAHYKSSFNNMLDMVGELKNVLLSKSLINYVKNFKTCCNSVVLTAKHVI